MNRASINGPNVQAVIEYAPTNNITRCNRDFGCGQIITRAALCLGICFNESINKDRFEYTNNPNDNFNNKGRTKICRSESAYIKSPFHLHVSCFLYKNVDRDVCLRGINAIAPEHQTHIDAILRLDYRNDKSKDQLLRPAHWHPSSSSSFKINYKIANDKKDESGRFVRTYTCHLIDRDNAQNDQTKGFSSDTNQHSAILQQFLSGINNSTGEGGGGGGGASTKTAVVRVRGSSDTNTSNNDDDDDDDDEGLQRVLATSRQQQQHHHQPQQQQNDDENDVSLQKALKASIQTGSSSSSSNSSSSSSSTSSSSSSSPKCACLGASSGWHKSTCHLHPEYVAPQKESGRVRQREDDDKN